MSETEPGPSLEHGPNPALSAQPGVDAAHASWPAEGMAAPAPDDGGFLPDEETGAEDAADGDDTPDEARPSTPRRPPAPASAPADPGPRQGKAGQGRRHSGGTGPGGRA
jgi:hypothetical protein